MSLQPPPCPCESDKLLSACSTFGIGGPARLFCEIHSIQDMQAMIAFCRAQGIAYLVMGKGSNCLFDDLGFNGLVLLNKITFCEFAYPFVHVGAGYSFALLGVQTARQGWSGLEFAAGIPGSVGGAVYMNAGASGNDTQSSLIEVSAIDEEGVLQVFPHDALQFAYRFSSFQKRHCAIVSAKFELTPLQDARKKQLGIVEYRTRTQPYSEKSAGCVFVNPPSQSAGALIDQCGLKGMRIGGAEVSVLHGNFIINKEGAKAKEVLELAAHVQKTIKEKTGVHLEMEIRYIPYQVGDV